MEEYCNWCIVHCPLCVVSSLALKYFIIVAPLYLGYPVLYFKLSENIVGSRQEIDKVLQNLSDRIYEY